MTKSKYCKLCGQDQTTCPFLKRDNVCQDADLYNQGYVKAFEDVTNFIHKRIDLYIKYDMQFSYIDDARMYKDLCNELLDVDFDNGNLITKGND